MELERAFLNNGIARNALDKLSGTNEIPAQMGYRFAKIWAKCKKETLLTEKRWFGLIRDFAVLDAEQKPVIKDGNPTFETKEKENFYNASFDELMFEKFSIGVLPVPLSSIKDSKILTPEELLAIEPILEIDVTVTP